MRGKAIIVGATKGGVGKSVSTYNLAYYLVSMGKRVLAVDFDSQANLTTCFGIEDTAADGVVITVNPQLLVMVGLQEFLKNIKKIKSRINLKLEVEGILLTMCEPRTNLCKVCTLQSSDTGI